MAYAIVLLLLPGITVAAGEYSLQGITRIGDTVYVTLQTASGHAQLLAVGDSENRMVYVTEWIPESREAVVMVWGQRLVLKMENASETFLEVAASYVPVNTRQERRPRSLPISTDSVSTYDERVDEATPEVSVSNVVKSVDHLPVVIGQLRQSQSNIPSGVETTGGQISRNRNNNTTSLNSDQTTENTPVSRDNSVQAVPVSRRPSMLPLNSSGLTAEEKQINKDNGTTGQRLPE